MQREGHPVLKPSVLWHLSMAMPMPYLHCWRWHTSVPAAEAATVPVLGASYLQLTFPHCPQDVFLKPNFFYLSDDSPAGTEELVDSVMQVQKQLNDWQSFPTSWFTEFVSDKFMLQHLPLHWFLLQFLQLPKLWDKAKVLSMLFALQLRDGPSFHTLQDRVIYGVRDSICS